MTGSQNLSIHIHSTSSTKAGVNTVLGAQKRAYTQVIVDVRTR